MTARNYFFLNTKDDFNKLLPGIIASAICHFLVIFILTFTPSRHYQHKGFPSAINVSLVSIPGPYSQPGPVADKQTPKQVKKAKTEKPIILPEPEPEVKKPEVKKPAEEIQPKTSLKKKTFKTSNVVKSAIKEMEKRVEETRPDSLSEALDKIKQKVEQTEKETGAAEGEEQAGSGAGPAGSPGGGEKRELTQADLYGLELKYLINKNWAFSEQLAGMLKDLETIVVIRILANGEIDDVWFEKKSGNQHLDESAYKAVLKSNPLPAIPPGMNAKDYTIGFVFTPAGLQ
jgi:colicin import membrane protein